eukprot:gene27082-biopygen17640
MYCSLLKFFSELPIVFIAAIS